MYSNALRLMSEGNYIEASEVLQEILKVDYGFSPAKKSLDHCKKQIETEQELNIIIENKRLQ